MQRILFRDRLRLLGRLLVPPLVSVLISVYVRMISTREKFRQCGSSVYDISVANAPPLYRAKPLYVMKACRQNVCATITAVELSLFKLPPLRRLCAGYLLYRAFLHLINWPETFGPRRTTFSNYSFLSFPRRDGGAGCRGREGAAGQQNETGDNLLPSSYKAQATAGPIRTRLLSENKAGKIKEYFPLLFSFCWHSFATFLLSLFSPSIFANLLLSRPLSLPQII